MVMLDNRLYLFSIVEFLRRSSVDRGTNGSRVVVGTDLSKRKVVNILLLSWFLKHSFTPYLSLSGQVGISSSPSKNADRKSTDLSGKHSFTLLFS